MVSKQARDLAGSGFCVVVPDLYASGDSDGIFAATDWRHWLRDISNILEWIQSQGGAAVQLWGEGGDRQVKGDPKVAVAVILEDPAVATVTLDDLAQTYDGDPKPATAIWMR